MIDVTVLAGTPGRVQIVIPGADIPTGSVWDITWEQDGHTGAPRGGSGVGAGEQVVVVDAAAPVGGTVVYTLRVGESVSSTASVSRPFSGGSILADLTGETIAAFSWQGDDPREGLRRFHVSDVDGSRRPPIRYAPAGDGGGALVAATVRPHTDTLRALLTSGEPLLLLHNADECDVQGCDVPPSEIVYITADGNSRGGRWGAAERLWSLSYVLAPDPEPGYRASTSTWDDLDAADLTWNQVDAMALTWDELDRTDWSQVGA